MIERLAGWAVRNPGGVMLGAVLLVGGGGWAMQGLRVDAFPDLTDVQVQVLVDAPGLSPLEIERLVAFPIEVAMNGLPRVAQVRSVSKYAFAGVTVVFEDGVDLYFARALVAERLQSVREGLPPGAEAALGPAQRLDLARDAAQLGIFRSELDIGVGAGARRHLRFEHVETLHQLVHAVAGQADHAGNPVRFMGRIEPLLFHHGRAPGTASSA